MDDDMDTMFSFSQNQCDENTAIQFILDRLNSKNNQIVYETVLKIKNLIIGNNKFKSIYLKEKIIKRLIEMINYYYFRYYTANARKNKTDKFQEENLDNDNDVTLQTDEEKQQSQALPVDSSSNRTILDIDQADQTNLIDLTNQLVIIFGSFALGSLEHVTKLIKFYNLHEIIFNLIRILNFNEKKSNVDNSQTRVKDTNFTDNQDLQLLESCLRCLSNLYTSSQLSAYLIYQLDKQLYSSNNLNLILNVFSLTNQTKHTILNMLTISSTSLSSASIKFQFSSNLAASNTSLRLDSCLKRFRNDLIKSDAIQKLSSLLISSQSKIQLNTLKFYASICFESLDASKKVLNTQFYDVSLLELISSYLSRENTPELQLYAAKCLTNLCRCSFLITKSSKQTEKEKQVLDTEGMEVSDSSTTQKPVITNQKSIESSAYTAFKAVNYKSQLIRIRTLPTLIRLCCTYSLNYRLDSISTNKELNIFFLIESINTLTYLIELSAELQSTASYLEQIIPILSKNILNVYTTSNFNFESVKTKTASPDIPQQDPSTDYKKPRQSTRIKQLEFINRVKSSTYYKNKNPSNNNNNSSSTSHGGLSLYSMFYLNYNQFATKGIHFKLNEHQYKSGLQLFRPFSVKESGEAVAVVANNKLKKYEKLQSNILNKSYKFLSELERNAYKRLLCVCFQALGTLASNNEEARRSISDNCELINKLVDAIHLNNIDINNTENTNPNDKTNFVNSTEVSRKLMRTIFYDITDNENNVKVSTKNLTSEDEDDDEEDDEDEEEDDENIDTESSSFDAYFSSYEGQNEIEMNLEQINKDSDEQDLIDEEDEQALDECDLDDDLNFNKNDATLLRLSALCLLHSLSRSVQQLRTKFLDNKLWMPLIDLIKRIKSRKQKLVELKQKRFTNNKRFKMYKFSSKFSTSSNNSSEKKYSIESKLSTQGSIETDIKEDSTSNDDLNKIVKFFSSSKKSSILKLNENDQDSMIMDNETENQHKELASASNLTQDHDRNYFIDLMVYDNLDGNLNEQNLITLTLAIIANLLLDFSPSKEIMVKQDIIKSLVDLLDFRNISIKVNCMWALMNLAFQADQKLKQQILSTITIEKLFQLLTEQDETLLIKTLGLIKNLICYRPHIDQIMALYGIKIIQAIIMVLESEYYNVSIKEQALCILANVADGSTSSKDFIMGNEDLLRKINSFMSHNHIELQSAAVLCVSNLVCSSDEGSIERQFKLKEMGFHRILQKLLHSNDPILFDRVKIALQQFCASSSSSSTAVSILQQTNSNSSSPSSSSSSSSSASSTSSTTSSSSTSTSSSSASTTMT